MSTVIKSIGYYYPLPELKDNNSNKKAIEYFKQFFELGKTQMNYVTGYDVCTELNKWLPYCDINGNWAWIKYIHNEEECNDTNIELCIKDFVNEINVLSEFINKYDAGFYESHFKFFVIDWYNGSDFPLIIK